MLLVQAAGKSDIMQEAKINVADDLSVLNNTAQSNGGNLPSV